MNSKRLKMLLLIACPLVIKCAESTKQPTYEQLKNQTLLLERLIAVNKKVNTETEARNIILERHNEQLRICNKELRQKLKEHSQALAKVSKEYGEYKKRVAYEEEIRKNEEWIIDEHGRLSLEKLQQKSPYT